MQSLKTLLVGGFFRAGSALFLGGLLGLATLLMLCFTPAGGHLALSLLHSVSSPFEFEYQNLEGSLYQGLHLKKVKINTPYQSYHFDTVKVDINRTLAPSTSWVLEDSQGGQILVRVAHWGLTHHTATAVGHQVQIAPTIWLKQLKLSYDSEDNSIIVRHLEGKAQGRPFTGHFKLRLSTPLMGEGQFKLDGESVQINTQAEDTLAWVWNRKDKVVHRGTLVSYPDFKLSGHSYFPYLKIETKKLERVESDWVALKQDHLWQLQGKGNAKEGSFEYTGWLSQDLEQAQIALKGQGCKILLGSRNNYVTANFELQNTLKNNQLTVEGKILLPKGRIQVGQTLGYVLSEDVVQTDNENSGATLLGVENKIQLEFGQDVQLASEDFNGKLRGILSLTQKASQPTLASGQLSIVQGYYYAFGQRLELVTANLRYHNTTLITPYVDFTALREVHNKELSHEPFQVGIKYTGPFGQRSPKLWSSIAVTQADILSLMITNQRADNLSQAQGQLLYQGATQLTSLFRTKDGKNPFDFRKLLRLDEIGIESINKQQLSSPSLENTLVRFGKQINQSVYLSYGMGILTPVHQWHASWRISRHLVVEGAHEEQDTSADILATFNLK